MPEINLSNKEIDLVRTVDPEMEVYGIPVTDVKVRPSENESLIRATTGVKAKKRKARTFLNSPFYFRNRILPPPRLLASPSTSFRVGTGSLSYSIAFHGVQDAPYHLPNDEPEQVCLNQIQYSIRISQKCYSANAPQKLEDEDTQNTLIVDSYLANIGN